MSSSLIKKSQASLSNAPAQLTDEEQMCSYLMEALGCDGFRRFAIALLIDGKSAEIWYADRKGALYTTEMSFEALDDFKRLGAILVALGGASAGQIGFEPVFVRQDVVHNRRQLTPEVIIDASPGCVQLNLDIQSTIHVGRGLFGRGTGVSSICTFCTRFIS